MMILPLLLVMILPKIMNDPDTKKVPFLNHFSSKSLEKNRLYRIHFFFKEMEQLNNLTNYNMPEMSEVITQYFSGGDKQKTKAVKAAKKRQ